MTPEERIKAAADELAPVEKYWPTTPEDQAIARALAVLRDEPAADTGASD